MAFKENIVYAVILAVWIVVKMTYLPLVVFATGFAVMATSYVVKVVRELRFYSDNQNLETCETTTNNPLTSDKSLNPIKDNKIVNLDAGDTSITQPDHCEDGMNAKDIKVVEDCLDSGVESRGSTAEIAVLKPCKPKNVALVEKVPLAEGIDKADKKGTKKIKKRIKRTKKTTNQPDSSKIPSDPWLTKPVEALTEISVSQCVMPLLMKRIDHVPSPPWLKEGVVAIDNGTVRSQFITTPITIPPDITF